MPPTPTTAPAPTTAIVSTILMQAYQKLPPGKTVIVIEQSLAREHLKEKLREHGVKEAEFLEELPRLE